MTTTPNERPVAKTVSQALRNDATDILELIDGGLQRYEGRSEHEEGSAQDSAWYRGTGDNRGKCWRCQAGEATEEMDGACALCVAWLRGEGDDPMPPEPQYLDGLLPEWMRGAMELYRRDLVDQIHNAPTLLERLIREGTNTRQRQILEGANLPQDEEADWVPIERITREQATERYQTYEDVFRGALVRAAELRARSANLSNSFGFEIAQVGDIVELTGLEIVIEETSTTYAGLVIVEHNIAWNTIAREVVDVDAEVMPPHIIVGELVEDFGD